MYRLIGYSGRRRFTHKVNGGCSALIIVAIIEARLEQAELEVLVRTKFLSLLDQFNTDDAAVVSGVARGADRVGVVSDLDETGSFRRAGTAGEKQRREKGDGQMETLIEHELPHVKRTACFDCSGIVVCRSVEKLEQAILFRHGYGLEGSTLNVLEAFQFYNKKITLNGT